MPRKGPAPVGSFLFSGDFLFTQLKGVVFIGRSHLRCSLELILRRWPHLGSMEVLLSYAYEQIGPLE